MALVLVGLLAAPAAAFPKIVHFHANLTVTTKHSANVRVTWVTKCDGERLRGRFYATTPFQNTIPLPNDGVAHRCHAAVWVFNLTHHRGIPKIDLELVKS